MSSPDPPGLTGVCLPWQGRPGNGAKRLALDPLGHCNLPERVQRARVSEKPRLTPGGPPVEFPGAAVANQVDGLLLPQPAPQQLTVCLALGRDHLRGRPSVILQNGPLRLAHLVRRDAVFHILSAPSCCVHCGKTGFLSTQGCGFK